MEQEQNTNENDPVREKVRRIIIAGERAKDDAAEGVEQVADKIEAQVHHTAERVRDIARDIRHTDSEDVRAMAEDARDKAGDQVQQIGQQLHERADEAMTAGGQRLQETSQRLRLNAPEGRKGDITARAADVLDQSGRYLQCSSPSTVRSDLERFIRENPFKAVFIGLSVGFLLARSRVHGVRRQG